MCTALSGVVPGASVESVQTNTESPFRVRREAIAARNSTMCTALSTVVCTTRGLSVKLTVARAKVAVTARAAVIVTLQAPVPVQLPLQPVKVEPATGVTVKVTAVPLVNAAEQAVPQEMPAGALVTVPLPLPVLLTVSVKDGKSKVAVTVVATVIVTVQVPVPVQPPPLQPVKVEPAAGAAVKVTEEPMVNEAVQVVPQEMPAGLLVTVPPPAPALETVSADVVETPMPVTSRERVSPSAVRLTFVLAVAAVVGANRTVTAWVAPSPTRVNGLPDTMLKGAGTDAVPVTVPLRVL